MSQKHRWLVLTACFVLSVCSHAAHAALVGYWPLDGDATATVGASGALVGGPTSAADRNGSPSGALAFASTSATTGSYVSVAGGGGLNGLSSGTISMWVNWSGTQDASHNSYGNVLSRQQNSAFSNNILGLNGADPATARITWQPYTSGGPAITAPAAVGDNVWRHVVVAFDSGNHRLYVDGNLQGSSAATGAFGNNPATPLSIGAWIGDGTGYSTARIDDVAVYDHLLSAPQISSLARQTVTPQTVLSNTPAVIANVNAQASGYYLPDGRLPQAAVNGAGLLGDANNNGVREHSHVHGGNMWLALTNDANGRWIKFNLNELQNLDSALIWNHNEVNFLGRQMTSALVQTSIDGVNWTTLGGGPTAFTTNATGASNYDQIQVLPLNNVQARFVRFGNLDNPVVNNGDPGYVGLSEVQFAGTRAMRFEKYEQVTGVTATATSFYAGRSPTRAVDGWGLVADSDGDGIQGHGNSPSNAMWLSNGEVTPSVAFDLGEDLKLAKMRVWNYNETHSTNLSSRGIKNADIYYALSTAGINLSDLTDLSNWTLLGNVDLTRADQTANYEAVDEFFFGNFGTLARYVLIKANSNYGDLTYTGLSEVQFFTATVPEPGTLALGAGLLLAGLFVSRRRAARAERGSGA